MQLIDAETMWACETCFYHNEGRCNPSIWCENGEQYRPAMNLLKVVDAVPVVRCRECKHSRETDMFGERTVLICAKTDYVKQPDGYCDEGVRRDNGE